MRASSNTLLGIMVASALTWVGCVSSHETERPAEVDASAPDAHVGADAQVGIDAHVEIDASGPLACLGAGEMGCASSSLPCCEGTYCQLGGYVLEYDTCVVRAVDGEACNYHTDCVSERCEGGMCRATACVSEGAECFAAFHCCGGFCPSEFTYGPSVCTLPLPAGEWCYSDAWCASGACRDGSCL